ncbi:uncharacterized protein BDV14DRAFT_197373 [Aspergillus stella-maris]|uniref:uncharacterized protein n=1 Tax=Aspergillus stella-maris TaxID=1810926 RepID=UPI003CCDD80C
MSTVGYGLPPMLLGSAATAIAAGLFTTMDLHTPSPFWIGVQVLAGVGVGIACQVPIIVNQAIVDASSLSSAMALTLFFQLTGDPSEVLQSGAAGVRDRFKGDELGVVLDAYVVGLQSTFILATALAAMATIVSCFTGVKSMESGPQTSGL